jgi:hypothetical protein
MSGRTRLAAMATAVMLACLPASARAVTTGTAGTGNELWSLCTDTQGGVHGSGYWICLGYVQGIADAVDTPNGLSGWRACRPEGATRGQLQDVVTRWLDQHPEQRHYSAATLVAKALAEAFPCKP